MNAQTWMTHILLLNSSLSDWSLTLALLTLPLPLICFVTPGDDDLGVSALTLKHGNIH